MLSAKHLSSQYTFSNKQSTNKETKYEMASVKQQTFTLRTAGVHSLLDRGVNYLLTGITKNLAVHGKKRF